MECATGAAGQSDGRLRLLHLALHLVRQELARGSEKVLGNTARQHKGDGANAVADQRSQQARRLGQRRNPPPRRPRCQPLVPLQRGRRRQQRRTPQGDGAAGGRSAVPAHAGDGIGAQSRERRHVLPGVGDGGRAADEDRARAVQRAHPPQPPQHQRHMRPPHPVIAMCLVEHNQPQPAQHFGPLSVMRQHGGVQHVWVGRKRVRAPPQLRTVGLGRVAVEGRPQKVGATGRVGQSTHWWGKGGARGRAGRPVPPAPPVLRTPPTCRWQSTWPPPRAGPKTKPPAAPPPDACTVPRCRGQTGHGARPG
eukprot:scaffold18892_cov183-Isochrysis_galbana.AAC.4